MIYLIYDGGKDAINEGYPLALHFFEAIKWREYLNGARAVKMDGRGYVNLTHLTVDPALLTDLANEAKMSEATLFYWDEPSDTFIKLEPKDVIIMPKSGKQIKFDHE